MIQIIQTYIEFLQTTPQNSVPIFDLLISIIVAKQYLTRDKYKYRTWVNRFIQYPFRPVEFEKLMQEQGMTDENLVRLPDMPDSGITVESDIGKGITRFIDKVVDILRDVFRKMTRHKPDELYEKSFLITPTCTRASLTITAVITDMIPIFEKLFTLSRYADAPMQDLISVKMSILVLKLKLNKQGGGLTRKKRSNKKRSNKKRTYKK